MKNSQMTRVIEDLAAAETTQPQGSVQVEIRRRGWLSTVVALGAGAVALAYTARVLAGEPTWLDWAILAALVMITGAYLAALADSRAPLLIADDQGVRIRRGAQWHGIAWPDIAQVEYHPRRSLFADGLVVIGVEHEDEIALRLTLATRVHGVAPAHFTHAIAGLCGPDTAVLELREPEAEAEAEAEYAEEAFAQEPEPTPEILVSEPVRASTTPIPLRSLMSGVRAEITRQRGTIPATIAATGGATALHLSPDEAAIRLPEAEQLRRAEPDLTELVPQVPKIDQGPAPLDLTVDVPDPVIGSVLADARERIGMSVDQVAERTRIRPHVIEAIEVDDFGPCGGDFYARGHLRTLARVLGVDATPLLADFTERYAHAPIDPRRVFEADLAAGSSGSIRGTRGGPNWSVLIAAVMTVVLIWSIARLITDNPAAIENQAPPLNPSGGLNSGASAAPEVPVVLTASGGGARVIVRNGSEIAFNGPLAFGQTATLQVSPPIRISTTDGSLVVTIDGDDRGAMGETGQEAQATYVVR